MLLIWNIDRSCGIKNGKIELSPDRAVRLIHHSCRVNTDKRHEMFFHHPWRGKTARGTSERDELLCFRLLEFPGAESAGVIEAVPVFT